MEEGRTVIHADTELSTKSENDSLSPADLDILNEISLSYIRSLPREEILRRLDAVSVERLADERALRAAEKILDREDVIIIRNFLSSEVLNAVSTAADFLKVNLAKSGGTSNRETDTLLVQSAQRVVNGYDGLSRYPKAVENIRRGADEGMINVFNFDRLILEIRDTLREPFHGELLLRLLGGGDLPLQPANLNFYLNRDITHTRGFHVDSYERSLKGLCYITDVAGLEFGPYCFVHRSHRPGPSRRANMKISELAAAPTEAPFVDPSMILPCVAPRGTLVLSDQSGVHRGFPQAPGHGRQVLVMRYMRSVGGTSGNLLRERRLRE
jgi:hypothetical protein